MTRRELLITQLEAADVYSAPVNCGVKKLEASIDGTGDLFIRNADWEPGTTLNIEAQRLLARFLVSLDEELPPESPLDSPRSLEDIAKGAKK
jgi:hypothetical protein